MYMFNVNVVRCPSRMRGAEAAKRAKILEEYLQRKREAAINKARGVAEIHGVSTALCFSSADFRQRSLSLFLSFIEMISYLRLVTYCL